MSHTPRRSIANFGGNLRFTPDSFCTPRSEAEVLELLDSAAGAGKTVRVVGARHAWSAGIHTDDVLIDLQHFNSVATDVDDDGVVWARVGGGCPIHRVLDFLRLQISGTLPSVGLITEQTIAGAISTGTHGSGRHCLSHYAESIRVAAFDPASGQARTYTFDSGDRLRAAQCALGCMGVVLEVCLRCVPQYLVTEQFEQFDTLDDVLANERDFPLQQFYLVPFLDTYYVQQRCVASEEGAEASWHAPFYRAYWFAVMDVTFHLAIKALLVLRSTRLLSLFYRRVLPRTMIRRWHVVDRSDRMLTMEHELFQHLEIELFVPGSQLDRALDFVRHAVHVFAGTPHAGLESVVEELESVGMDEALEKLRGTYAHHYPICIRRVLVDQTMLSMASIPPDGSETAYYAISMITYSQRREPFYRMAEFLAQAMTQLYSARLHWGKYFPLDAEQIAAEYPQLAEFRNLCRQVDPHGVFRNGYANHVLGFGGKDGWKRCQEPL